MSDKCPNLFMINLVIFGSGNQANLIFYEVMKNKNINFLGFVDDKIKKGKIVNQYNKKNYYNLGKISEVLKKNKNTKGIIGVGLNYLRKKILINIIKINKNFKFHKIISKNAIINHNVTIKDGSFISSNVVINSNTIIGKHCLINTSSLIEHDNIFEDFSSTGPGVITGGNVNVGECSFIGIGSIIKNNISIKSDTVIGASSYVNKDCLSKYLYVGIPCKKIRKRLKNENYLI